MSKVLEENYLECYDNFILQLKIIFTENETNKILDNIKNMANTDKINKGKLFVELITSEHFDDFLKCKIKIFSHKNNNTKKISESLLDNNLCLKNLLNNQPDAVKKVIWSKLHIIYIASELLKPVNEQNNLRLDALNNLLNTSESSDLINYTQTKQSNQFNSNINSNASSDSDAKNKLKGMLGVDVNNETSDMIDDIVASFEKVLSGNASSNPLSGIMEISEKISVKYADKINSGEIELDKLMKCISKKIPGMESILGGMMGTGSAGGAGGGLGGLGGLGDMMSGMMGGGTKKPKEKIIINENFSTADVQVGLNKEEDKKSINIGNILKIADGFGVIPGGKQSTSGLLGSGASGSSSSSESNGLPDLSSFGDMSNIPHLGKMMEMMEKLGKTETQEDADALKMEMDSFLQSELGLDVNKLNKELENVSNNIESI